MAQVEQKRIGQLVKLDDITTLIQSKSAAKKWLMAVDYVVDEPEEAGEAESSDEEPEAVEDIDKGTRYISMDRVGLLTASRLVPQNMLPHRVDSVKDGTMSIGTTKWIFTETSTGDKFVDNDPDTGSGESLASLEYIYRDAKTFGNRTLYTQYRFVPDSDGEAGKFVPIPNDLVMIDGDGTVIHDDDSAYTRKVDINIGQPGIRNQNTVIDIQGGQLVHTVSGVSQGTYPVQVVQTPGFGSNIYTDNITVTSTGHIEAITDQAIKIPDTAASSSTPGLVKIESDSTNIKPIGSQPSIGTVPSTGYVLVAASDHVHTAKPLTLSNTNDGTKTYNGSAPVTYDFNNFLNGSTTQVKLPTDDPVANGQFLTIGIDNNNEFVAKWANPQDIIHPRYAFIPVSGTVTSSGTTLTLGTPSDISSNMSVANNVLSGILSSKVFLISYYFELSVGTLDAYLDNLEFYVTVNGSNATRAIHVVDESFPLPNYISGTQLYVPDAGVTTCSFKLKNTRSSTWTLGANSIIQIAEVK